MEETNQSNVVVQPPNKEKILKIWKVALTLAIITAAEFAVAFMVPHEMKYFRIIIFLVMTIVKAFYIVAEFMHLGHELKILVYVVIIPFVAFVSWLIAALMYEGNHILLLH